MTACRHCGRDSGPASDRQIEQAAVALVAARLGQVPRPTLDEILRDMPVEEIALFLAAVAAWMVAETTGGERWLQRFGLAVAGEGDR